MYDLSIADLSIPGTSIGVCLRLHGCREIIVQFRCKVSESFPAFLRRGRQMGISLYLGPQRAKEAVSTIDAVMADARSHVLDKSDPLFAIVTNYSNYQTMRERIRQIALALDTYPKATSIEIQRTMCALSVWLMMYRMTGLDRPGEIDAKHANVIRAQTLRVLQDHRLAKFTIACSANHAYVQAVGNEFRNLDDAIQMAARSDTTNSITWTNTDSNRKH